jgi:hypothetical protein
MSDFTTERHVLNLSAGGTLRNSGNIYTPATQLSQIFAGFTASGLKSMTIFFHGGLVAEGEANDFAKNFFFKKVQDEFGSYPVFVIWESGPLESIQSALLDIFSNSPLFLKILQKLMKHVGRKLNREAVMESAMAEEAALMHDALEAALESEMLPAVDPDRLSALDPSSGAQIPPVSQAEITALTEDLATDPIANAALQSVLAELARSTPEAALTEGSTETPAVKSNHRTAFLSPKVLAELQEAAATREAAGAAEFALTPASIWLFVGKIFVAVIDRFNSGTDHGFEVTILEEIYRHLYADKVGRFLWDEMKENAQEAYAANPALDPGGAPTDDFHGGTLFITLLKEHLDANGPFELNLIGHSAGCIHICHFVERAAKILGPNLTLRSVTFTAPACNFATFHEFLMPHASAIKTLRVFVMKDELERKDPLVKGVRLLYPHSLLYLVSGILEERTDTPLIGLARHLQRQLAAGDLIGKAVQDFLTGGANNTLVFAATAQNASPGAMAGFTSHYGTPGPMHDQQTLASMAILIHPA